VELNKFVPDILPAWVVFKPKKGEEPPEKILQRDNLQCPSYSCGDYKDCHECSGDRTCGWCNDGCVSGNQFGPLGTNSCFPYRFNNEKKCDDHCSAKKCGECVADKACGWCPDTGCVPGNAKSPLYMKCSPYLANGASCAGQKPVKVPKKPLPKLAKCDDTVVAAQQTCAAHGKDTGACAKDAACMACKADGKTPASCRAAMSLDKKKSHCETADGTRLDGVCPEAKDTGNGGGGGSSGGGSGLIVAVVVIVPVMALAGAGFWFYSKRQNGATDGNVSFI
jgi:hypothetical protein